MPPRLHVGARGQTGDTIFTDKYLDGERYRFTIERYTMSVTGRFHHGGVGSAYPDYFILGDPHINYYEGTAEFDDLDLYLPEGL